VRARRERAYARAFHAQDPFGNPARWTQVDWQHASEASVEEEQKAGRSHHLGGRAVRGELGGGPQHTKTRETQKNEGKGEKELAEKDEVSWIMFQTMTVSQWLGELSSPLR
jgi:hypothetical protein